MSVILVDLGDAEHDVMVGNAGWRKTLQVLRPLGVLDDERLLLLETAWLGQKLTEMEARAIGEALVSGVLSTVNWSGDVYPPSGYWVDPGAHVGEHYELATLWPSWLRAFAAFCLTCKGFVVY